MEFVYFGNSQAPLRMKSRLFFLYLIVIICPLQLLAQSFVHNNLNKAVPANVQLITDTITVSGLTTPLGAGFGLDTANMRLNYSDDGDLRISLMSPDGTVVELSDELGSGGSDFNVSFDMGVSTLINESGTPFTGHMRPEGWLGNFNNGQSGNGKWVLRITRPWSWSTSSGTLQSWGLYFDGNPAPVRVLDSSSLPIVVINTGNRPIPVDSDKLGGTMGIISNGAGAVNHLSDPFNNYNNNIGIDVHGSSSRAFAQKSYNVETDDASGAQLDASLLGMPAEHDWILYGAWDDKSLIRDIITYQLANDMGSYAPRTRLCELVVNGDYRGVYVLIEKIKRDHNRVDVSKLASTDVTTPTITGGYVFEVDRPGTVGYDCWTSNYPSCAGSTNTVYFDFIYPKATDLNTQQRNYISGYVDSFETALTTQSVYDTLTGYRKFIDVPSFIDFSLQQELGRNVDGYRLSSYLHKDRNQKLQAGPIWDFNLAYGNADYYNGSDFTTFQWDFPCPNSDGSLNPFWWQTMLTDTNYVKELKCRYTALRSPGYAYDSSHVFGMIDSLTNLLAVPKDRHFTRWPILGVYLWPNAYVGNTYADEINYLKGWIFSRFQFMDGTLTLPSCIPVAPPPPPTGIAPVVTAGGISIYPNPASSTLHINAGSPLRHVAIFNTIGQKVYEATPNTTQTDLNLAASHLSGLYTITVQTATGSVSQKIMFE